MRVQMSQTRVASHLGNDVILKNFEKFRQLYAHLIIPEKVLM